MDRRRQRLVNRVFQRLTDFETGAFFPQRSRWWPQFEGYGRRALHALSPRRYQKQPRLRNALCLGWVRTEMAGRAIEDVARKKGVSAEELSEAVVKANPLRRMASSAEIAGVIAFLSSDDASFITGAVLSADGGGGIVDVGTFQFGFD